MDLSPLYPLSALEIFRIIADEFEDVPDETIQKKMLFASVFIDKECYGDSYNVALALMTAHLMALPGGVNGGYSTSTGKVTSMKEGDLSIGYGNLSSDSSWLGQTTYGQLLDQLQRKRGMHLTFMTRGPVAAPVDDWKFQ
ncbi:virion structural protein [Xanthomonas phage vB_XveM_DIBBI]|uniref:Uncharacterized protein n=3 Tax=Dibbivirus TaxID=2843374 RepID=I3PGU5_9CAUD|nr:virion structural protein [Xanthomonas phage vB_XveM_DIBBI]AEX65680.1 hypothetical protein DIBBI_012 [Xanthomonas phage vB_XveM_DIBBI]